jgi:hypothetical protein
MLIDDDCVGCLRGGDVEAVFAHDTKARAENEGHEGETYQNSDKAPDCFYCSLHRGQPIREFFGARGVAFLRLPIRLPV